MASTEIRNRRRILRYRSLVKRQAVQIKNRISGLLMESGVSYNKLRLHRMSSLGRRYACVIGVSPCRLRHQHTMDSSYPEAVENPTWLLTGLSVPILSILHFSHDWKRSL